MTVTLAANTRSAAHSGEPRPAPTRMTADSQDDTAIGAIAMSIVHDLRNPLATIHGAAEMLSDSRLLDPQSRRLAQNMYNASLRIQEMLQEYVDAYQSGRRQRHSSNLRSLVAHAVKRISALAEAQSVIVSQHIAADMEIILDRRRIGSVLANLLANALEAMPAGGWIHIYAAVEKRSVVIRIRDTGPGIPAAIRRRLFEPFVTAGKASGWGLGLAQARKVMLDHGGEIWHESPSGGGACFALSLPRSQVPSGLVRRNEPNRSTFGACGPMHRPGETSNTRTKQL